MTTQWGNRGGNCFMVRKYPPNNIGPDAKAKNVLAIDLPFY